MCTAWLRLASWLTVANREQGESRAVAQLVPHPCCSCCEPLPQYAQPDAPPCFPSNIATTLCTQQEGAREEGQLALLAISSKALPFSLRAR